MDLAYIHSRLRSKPDLKLQRSVLEVADWCVVRTPPVFLVQRLQYGPSFAVTL